MKDQKKKNQDFLPREEYELIVERTFNMLLSGFTDLRKNQGNEDTIKSVDSFFARELVISVNIEEEIQEYRIHEDPAH